MKNFWIEIAKEIGVEFGEKFIYTIDDYGYKVKIEEDGLLLELDNGLVDDKLTVENINKLYDVNVEIIKRENGYKFCIPII